MISGNVMDFRGTKDEETCQISCHTGHTPVTLCGWEVTRSHFEDFVCSVLPAMFTFTVLCWGKSKSLTYGKPTDNL